MIESLCSVWSILNRSILKGTKFTMKRTYIFSLITILLLSVGIVFLLKESEEIKPGILESATTYNLRIGHDMPITTAQHFAALRFADIVNYKTNGLVYIDVCPNQQLGTDQAMIEMARNGEMEKWRTGNNYATYGKADNFNSRNGNP